MRLRFDVFLSKVKIKVVLTNEQTPMNKLWRLSKEQTTHTFSREKKEEKKQQNTTFFNLLVHYFTGYNHTPQVLITVATGKALKLCK